LGLGKATLRSPWHALACDLLARSLINDVQGFGGIEEYGRHNTYSTAKQGH
jgi:hypothetical protein